MRTVSAFVVVVCVATTSAVTLEVMPDGALEIGNTDIRLSPGIVEKGRNSGRIISRWPAPLQEHSLKKGEWRYEFFQSVGFRRSTGIPLAHGLVLLSPMSNGTADFSQSITADMDMEVARVGSFMEIPVASVTGLTWRVGNKTGSFPHVYVRGRSVLVSEKATLVELPVLPDGGFLSMQFPEPTSIVIQDARDWGQNSFSLRILTLPKDGRFVKGEKLSLQTVFSAADGVEIRVPCPKVAVAGQDWIPVDYRKNVRKGSALDLSGLLHKPAGRFGFLRADGEHFAFEGRPGVPQRFYGVNLCYSANVPTNACEIAERLSRLGFNAVRIHHYDNGDAVFDDRNGSFIKERLDRLDKLLAECFKRGIYVTTDLFTGRFVSREQLGLDGNPKARAPFKTLVVLHDTTFDNWKRFAREFLLHRNPYTGRTYAEEPGIVTMVLVNEGRLHMEFPSNRREAPVREAWRKWLAERRKADPTAFAGVPGDCAEMRNDHPHFAVTELFAAEMERRFALRAIKYLRSIGVKALISNINDAAYSAPFQGVREVYDYVDDHSYIAHPWHGGRSWQPPGFVPTPTPFLESEKRRPALNAFARVADKPFVMTEWNWCHPDEGRACGGMLVPAMAALQDWCGIWRFAYAHHVGFMDEEKHVPNCFDLAADPLMLLADRAGVFLYLRGDLEPHKEAYILDIDERNLVSAGRNYPDSRPLWCSAAWKARFATTIRGRVSVSAHHIPYSSVSAVDCPVSLPKSSQVSIEPDISRFRINTANFSGGYVHAGVLKTDALEVDVGDDEATVWAVSLDGKPLSATRHVLVGHFTDCRIEGNAWLETSDGLYTLNSKVGRPLAKRGRAKVALSIPYGKWDAYALATDGNRKASVPCEIANGCVTFIADTACFVDDATFVYELTLEE